MKFNLLLAVVGCFIAQIHSLESNVSGNDKNCNNSTLPLRFANNSRKPNIILILTDDQDAELGSMNFMPRTKQYLKKQGAEFRHAYATTPMCCPSRSSILTGQYVHNHHVYSNNENCSSPNWRKYFEDKSFATYVQKEGYKTAYFGKYLNQYDGNYIPNGWDYWNALIRNSKYYNYSVNVNGQKIKHGFDYSKDYYPDLIRNESIKFLQNHFANSSENNKQPLMMVLSFPSPHGPEDSAPQYSHMFPNVTTHHTPSYDYAPNFDKQWILKNTGKMTNLEKRFTDILMTKRLQTLQSVDVSVETIYRTLQSIKELENTFLFYMSDHGYHLGQFGLVKGKSFPFEVDVKIPFMVRGPGIDAGSIINDVVLNIDIAPTFLSIAGVRPPQHMDGKSILNFQKNCFPNKNKNTWRKTFLIESPGKRNYELLENSKSKINRTLRPYTKQQRLAFECQNSDDLQLPCKSSQKWYCVQDVSGDWRKHKCKMIDQSQTSQCRCARSVDDAHIKNTGGEIIMRNQSDKTTINENRLLFLKSKLSFFEKHKLKQMPCKNQMNCMIKKSISNESALKESQNHVDFIINQLKRKLSNWRKVSRILSRLDNERAFVDSSFNMINKNSNCECGQNANEIAVTKKKHRKIKRKMKSENCSEPGMFCFRQDRNHWRTEPMWQFDSFCSCNNAANNSYSCLRTIDDNHNFLYCEFVTNFITFYDLNQDKYQRENRISLLSHNDRRELHDELISLKSCKGDLCNNYKHTFAVST